MTQDERVLDHLTKWGSIEPLEAWNSLGVYRLAAVICRLRQQGHRITSKRHGVFNRWGDTVHVALYKIEKE